jgi:LysM repeat protein
LRRLWPVAFLLVIVGLASALVAGGVMGGGGRSPGEAYSTTATTILDLSPEALEQSPPSTEQTPAEGASQDDSSDQGLAAATAEDEGTLQAEDANANESTSTAQAGATADAGAEESGDEAVSAEAGKPPTESYTVKQGDTPYSIARSLGTTADELMELNGIDDPTGLQIGDVLQVPKP